MTHQTSQMRRNTIVFAVVLILLSAFTQDWVLFDSPEGTVMFPQKPSVDTQTVATAIGDLKMMTCMYEVQDTTKDDNMVYGYITSTYPPDMINSSDTTQMEKYFKGATSGSVRNVQGKLLSEEKVTISGFPGRLIRVGVMNDQYIITLANYLVRNKAIMMQVISPARKEGNPAARRFMGSLKLK